MRCEDLATKLDRMAEREDKLGLEDGDTLRDWAKLVREVREDFRRLGEDI